MKRLFRIMDQHVRHRCIVASFPRHKLDRTWRRISIRSLICKTVNHESYNMINVVNGMGLN